MNIGVREGVSGVSGDTPGRRTGNGVGLETSGEKTKFETGQFFFHGGRLMGKTYDFKIEIND